MKEKIKNLFKQFFYQNDDETEKISDVLYGRSGDLPLFRDKNLMIIVSIVTLFLQIISFVTTWQGAKTYFQEIFFLAPLLFALSIQMVVYFLANSVRRKATIFMVISLVLSVSCSTYFSYIGIYNVVNPPQKYLEDTYSNYQLQLEETYNQTKLNVKSKAKDSVNELLNGILEEEQLLQQQIKTYENMQNEINKVNANVSSSITPPYRWNYENYEDYVVAYNAYLMSISSNSQVENQQQIEAILSKNGFKDSQEALESYTKAKSMRNMVTSSIKQVALEANINMKTLNEQIEGLRTFLLNSTEEKNENVDQIISQIFNVYSTLGLKNITDSTSISVLITNTDSKLNENLMMDYTKLSNLTATNNEKLSNAPMQLKQRMEAEISSGINYINLLNTLVNESKKVEKQNYVIYDMYTLPIINIMTKNTRPMALFCFILAALVDLLSILFAFIVRKRPSALTQNKVSALFHGGDEALSELIHDSLSLGLVRIKNISLLESHKPENIILGLCMFLNEFETSNIAIHEGYSMICDEINVHAFSELVSVLNQCNFLKIISKKELFNEDSDEKVVLLKTKFVVWASKRISETERMMSEVNVK